MNRAANLNIIHAYMLHTAAEAGLGSLTLTRQTTVGHGGTMRTV